VTPVADARSAFARLGAHRFDVLMTELKLPGLPAGDLVTEVHRLSPHLPVILMVSYAGVRSAVEAVRNGAAAYIAKPFEKDELLLLVSRTLQQAALEHDNAAFRFTAGLGESPRPLIGGGLRIKRARDLMARLAGTREPVLIRGEHGAGRSHCARIIHSAGARSCRPFVTFACSFETAGESRLRERMEMADGGTLVLEEVSALDDAAQSLLFRLLQDQAVPGGSGGKFPDPRIMATTCQDLEEAILHGAFRKDLFARLSAASIELPALRDRREDIPELVRHFLHRIARREGQPFRHVDAEALRILQKHAWPGNLRELELVVERAALVETQPGSLRAAIIAPWLEETSGLNGRADAIAGEPLERLPLAEVEKRVILDTLAKFEGHRAKTATALGIGIRTLGIKIKKWREEGVLQEHH
jgi:DNA-binding NtrC family response regulator